MKTSSAWRTFFGTHEKRLKMTDKNSGPQSVFPPRLSYYHANEKGTGSAIQMELQPAWGEKPGYVWVEIAGQKTAGTRSGEGTAFPSFDWANKTVFRLDCNDLSEILQVMRGVNEKVKDGKGLFHKSSKGTTIIKFEHVVSPRVGYMFDVRKKGANGEMSHRYFMFDATEAYVVLLALEQSMGCIAFGIPKVG